MINKEITDLISELFHGEFHKDITDEDIERIASQPNIYSFFRYDNDRIIAMTVLYVQETYSRKAAFIEEVSTLKEYRNMGHGSSLINEAIEKAKELGVTCIELTCRPEITPFYESLGFYKRDNNVLRKWINRL